MKYILYTHVYIVSPAWEQETMSDMRWRNTGYSLLWVTGATKQGHGCQGPGRLKVELCTRLSSPFFLSKLLSYTSVSEFPFPFSVGRVRREAKGAACRESLQELDEAEVDPPKASSPWGALEKRPGKLSNSPSDVQPAKGISQEIHHHRTCANPLHWVKGEGGFY